MLKEPIKIQNIPAILWGETSDKIIIAIHGAESNKEDKPIELVANLAVQKGYQIISFDLPEHGQRKNDKTLCKVQNCIKELQLILQYAKEHAKHISVFANSIGAYFSLMSFQNDTLDKVLFLSPIVNMERLIENIMAWFQISSEQLKAKQIITTPMNQTLYWDYYCFVKEHPILKWNHPTKILYGSEDELCEFDIISGFTDRFNCTLTVAEGYKHYFHTAKQMALFSRWLESIL